MKPNQFYKMLMVIAFMLLLNQFSGNAQSWNANGTLNGFAFPDNLLGTATGYTYTDIDFFTNSVERMILTTGGDLNMYNAVNGYQIGAKQVLYTGGDPTSIFVGGQIGLTYTSLVFHNIVKKFGSLSQYVCGLK